jgi:hypothetical protein
MVTLIGCIEKLKTGNYARNFKYLKGTSGDKNNGVSVYPHSGRIRN